MDEDKITTTDIEFSDDYAEALDTTPKEVRMFMWSEAFKLILTAIAETYKLTESQKEVVKRVAIETLIGTITPISRQIKLSDAGITNELQDKILEAINEEIVSRALAQVELYNELNEEQIEEASQKTGPSDVATPTVKAVNAPSPADVLASIQDRLTKPSTVAPITRDYSVTRATPAVKAPDTPKMPSMDIYREAPEK